MLRIFLCIFLCVLVNSEDESCVNETNGEKGICVHFKDCPSAVKDIKFKIYPQICSFNGTSKIPIICCLEGGMRNLTGLLLPLTVWKSPGEEQGQCPPFPFGNLNEKPNGTIQGLKAFGKCLEYQSKIHLPCSDNGDWEALFCFDRRPDKIVGGGGLDAEENEFPHMALLGFGKNFNIAMFGCGGSLISETFILTAGHCTATSMGVEVSFAVFGLLRRADLARALPENIRRFKRIIRHPEYKSPSIYHDIALLEMDKEVQFTFSVRPACLHVGTDVLDDRAYATGWGALGHRGPEANILQNVPLWKVADEACETKFPEHRRFLRGYDNVTQMCYGDDGQIRDTCSGDSGGPLQIRNAAVFCTHLILGVTSFGRGHCGEVGYPGIYTRVSHYIPWIESVVWP